VVVDKELAGLRHIRAAQLFEKRIETVQFTIGQELTRQPLPQAFERDEECMVDAQAHRIGVPPGVLD